MRFFLLFFVSLPVFLVGCTKEEKVESKLIVKEKKNKNTQLQLEIQRNLEKEVTLDFVDCPLNELIEFIKKHTGMRVSIDPSVYKEFPNIEELRINVAVDRSRFYDGLKIILSLYDLYCYLDNDQLVISLSRECDPISIIYDISVLINNAPTKKISEEQIINFVKNNINLAWEKEHFISLEGNVLIIHQTKNAHEKISSFLSDFKKKQSH